MSAPDSRPSPEGAEPTKDSPVDRDSSRGEQGPLSPVLRVLGRAGEILVVWAVLVALENVVVGVGYRRLFAGYWEMAAARKCLSPMLMPALVPFALVTALLGELATLRTFPVRDRARSLLQVLGFVFGAVVAVSVSTGRHTASLAVKIPFALVTGLVAFVLVRLALRSIGTASRGTRALVGLLAFGLFWAADAFILPRLYPGFHGACFVVAMLSAALVAGLFPERSYRVGLVWLVVSTGLVAYVPAASRRVARADNLRLVLLEKAPLLGRAVRLAALVAEPPPTDDVATVGGQAPGEVVRALDWTAGDLVLVTIDALRADHVSSYGYARKTTPEIDALAARGTRFEHAYCPTPHTSYSVTSMLTGKYMRPLLTLGVGEDSDTWATLLRKYGYRTAAFYPPAVFFIDEARFTSFRDAGLGFEYRKVEFADRAVRMAQVRGYLQDAPKDKPLFLWVHLFEPHEPYVARTDRVFGEGRTDVDRYDGEIAEADATVGEIVRAVEQHRKTAAVVVTADHGEEFGDHGGRYHGTTVYEEQVRVPLVVAGAGVKTQVVSAPVQTIDLLPTALSALGIPRPARIRGRDLGTVLRDGEVSEADKAGFAFSETDDFTLVAEGRDRLVCARKVGACSRYDVDADPKESRDVGPQDEARTKALRGKLARTEHDHGRYEGGVKMPDAIRRGRQGEVDAADDVAALFDDASLDVRRAAAETAFALHVKSTQNNARRAFTREEDPLTKRFLALLLSRLGDPDPEVSKSTLALFAGDDLAWKRRAALALADGGDGRGALVLAAWLSDEHLELDAARELLALIARHKAKAAVPLLLPHLHDLRVRPYVAETLGQIGDPSAKEALVASFKVERYRPTRVKLAAALAALGAKEEMFAPLAQFAGVPEPLENAVDVAQRTGLLKAHGGLDGRLGERGADADAGTTFDKSLTGRLTVGIGRTCPASTVRVLVGTSSDEVPELELDGGRVQLARAGNLAFADVPCQKPVFEAKATASKGLVGVWIVPLADELPPPPKEAWDAGPDADAVARDLDGGGASIDAGLSADAKAE